MRRYWKKVKSPKRGAREGPPAAPLRLGRGPAASVRFLAQGQERGGGTVRVERLLLRLCVCASEPTPKVVDSLVYSCVAVVTMR